MTEKPILLGKVEKINDIYTLMGHMGDVQRINSMEYEILKLMDGFRTIDEISKLTNLPVECIDKIFHMYQGEKKVSILSKWNQVGWCEKCRVHVSGEVCDLCGKKTEKIEFSPPCDPFIGFSKEREFILSALHDRFGISLPKNSFFLINNGVLNNIFFWEIEYAGTIILRIDFQGMQPDAWKYSLMEKRENIERKSEYTLTSESIRKCVEANTKKMNKLENDSIAIIVESASFFKTTPLLYFSAGKESMVMYSLVKKANISSNVLTVVTGVEFPEDISFIQEMSRIIEKEPCFKYFYYQDNGDKVINMLNKQKKLSAKDPWCRAEFKLKLKNKGTEEIYKGNEFVAFEGSRWYENDFRRRHPKVNFISSYPHQVWIHPIAEWNAYDIWLYLFKEKLPINPMYFKGFQRTTCWLCPIVNPIHLYYSQKQYPELWNRVRECRLDAFEDDTTHDLAF